MFQVSAPSSSVSSALKCQVPQVSASSSSVSPTLKCQHGRQVSALPSSVSIALKCQHGPLLIASRTQLCRWLTLFPVYNMATSAGFNTGAVHGHNPGHSTSYNEWGRTSAITPCCTLLGIFTLINEYTCMPWEHLFTWLTHQKATYSGGRSAVLSSAAPNATGCMGQVHPQPHGEWVKCTHRYMLHGSDTPTATRCTGQLYHCHTVHGSRGPVAARCMGQVYPLSRWTGQVFPRSRCMGQVHPLPRCTGRINQTCRSQSNYAKCDLDPRCQIALRCTQSALN